MPNTGGLVKKSECNTEITELESKTPCITGLSTTSTLNAVENRYPTLVI